MQRSAALTLLICVAAFGQHVHTDREGARLLPLPKEEGVWHFAVYGDRTGGPREGVKVLAEAVGETNLLDPDLVMTVGDLIQGYNTTEPWMAEMREFRDIMNRLNMPWYPVAGNHDVYWRGKDRPDGEHEVNYEKHFGPLWYWFRHKNAAFVVLYTDEGDPEKGDKGFRLERHTQMSKRQLEWLRGTLEKTRDATHVFVFMHHPRWVTDYYPGTNFAAMHAELKRPGNVRAAFAGHIHQMRYDGTRDGIEYFALATTGGGLGPVVPRAGALHHQNVVTVRDDGIAVATIPVGGVIDPRSVTPELVAEVRKLAGLGAPEVVRPMVVGVDVSAGDHAIRLVNPSAYPIDVTVQVDPGRSLLRFEPGHAHFELAPGKSRLFETTWQAFDVSAGLSIPEIVIGVDVLAADRRIALPAMRVRMAAELATLPEAAFAATSPAAVRLDGADDCLMIPSRSFDLPQGPFTVEGWMRADRFKSRNPFLAKTESSEWSVFVNDGRPTFSVHLDGKYVTAKHEGEVLKPGVWHHVAGVFDGEEVRLYVDGRLTGRVAGSGRRSPNRHPFYVGADPDGRGRPVDPFAGAIDEVRVSATARYGAQDFAPSRRHEADDDTVILLHLDRPIGPFAPSHGGASSHAELVGEPRFEPVTD